MGLHQQGGHKGRTFRRAETQRPLLPGLTMAILLMLAPQDCKEAPVLCLISCEEGHSQRNSHVINSLACTSVTQLAPTRGLVYRSAERSKTQTVLWHLDLER